jgi:transposase
MRTVTTRPDNGNGLTPVLYMALELDNRSWKLAFSTGLGERPRRVEIRPRDRGGLLREIERAKVRFGRPAEAQVISCYEAGREGFWLHRFLVAQGVDNRVVDSSSIQVNRRFRRAKTDRLDAGKLLEQLIKSCAGSKEWHVVHVPEVEAEDARQLHRELETIKQDRTAVSNRIKGLLATQGLKVRVSAKYFRPDLAQARLWDGAQLPSGLHERLLREWEHWCFLTTRLEAVKGIRSEQRKQKRAQDRAVQQIERLEQLKGIGVESSTELVYELFAWREIKNRRQLGGLSGLSPTPFASGGTRHEQGISKGGNPRIRRLMIELAWGWVRYQPESALTRWFEQKFGSGGARIRKIGIVALARKLLIALWRYLEAGVIPDGATLKQA